MFLFIMVRSWQHRCARERHLLFHAGVVWYSAHWITTSKVLSSESIQGTALPLQCVDHIHCRHGLATGVFRVRDGIPDHVLQEHLQDSTCFFVDESRDAFDTSTPGQTTNGGFGDSLDIVSQHLPMTFGSTFSQSLSSLSSSRHEVRRSL